MCAGVRAGGEAARGQRHGERVRHRVVHEGRLASKRAEGESGFDRVQPIGPAVAGHDPRRLRDRAVTSPDGLAMPLLKTSASAPSLV